MKLVITTIVLILLFAVSVFAQPAKGQDRYKTVLLRKLPYETNSGSSSKLKLKAVVFLGIFETPEPSMYIFHLRDSKSGFEFGNEPEKHPTSFVVCSYETIGKALTEQLAEWSNKNVNVYIDARDVGFTQYTNVALVTKIELLDRRGRVVKTIQ